MNKQKNKKKVIAFLLSMLMLISLFQNISYTPIADSGETESVASESDAQVSGNDELQVSTFANLQENQIATQSGEDVRELPNASVRVLTYVNGVETEITDSTVLKNGDKITVFLDWKISNLETNRVTPETDLVYDLKATGVAMSNSSGNILSSNVPVGTYLIDEDGKLHLKITDRALLQKSDINGGVSIDGVIDVSSLQEDENGIVKAEIAGTTIQVQKTDSSVMPSVRKSRSGNVYSVDGKNYQDFTVEITVNGNADNLAFDDVLGDNLTLVGNIKVNNTEVTPTVSGSNVHYDIGAVKKGEKYTITYTTEISNNAFSDDYSWWSSDSGNYNTAKVSDSNGKSADSTTFVMQSKTWIKKSSRVNDDGTITWTVVVNDGDEIDLSGAKVTDVIPADLKIVGDVTVTDANGKSTTITGDEFSQNGYTFADGAKGKYTFTYKTMETGMTSGPQNRKYTNKARITDTKYNVDKTSSDTATIKGNWVTKEVESVDTVAKEITWKTTITVPDSETDGKVLSYYDTLGIGLTYKTGSMSVLYSDAAKVTGGWRADANITVSSNAFTMDLGTVSGANTITITYKTTYDPGEYKRFDFKNTAKINWDGTDSNPVDATYHYENKDLDILQYKYVRNSKGTESTWGIQINPLNHADIVAAINSGSKLIIYDKLQFTSESGGALGWTPKADIVQGSIKMSGQSTDLITATVDSDGTIQFNLTEYVKNNPNASYVEFEYTVKLSDETVQYMIANNITRISEENSATAYLEDTDNTKKEVGKETGNGKTTPELGTLLTKSYTYDSNTAPYAKYKIEINPNGYKLIDGSGTLTLEDTLGKNLQIVLSTIALTDADGNAITGIQTDYDTTTRVLKIANIPDQTPCYLSYDVFVDVEYKENTTFESLGSTVDVSNACKLYHVSQIYDSKNTTITGNVQKSRAWAESDTGAVVLTKHHGALVLPDAEFKLTAYKYDRITDSFVEDTDYSSNSSQGVTINNVKTGAAGTVNVTLFFDRLYKIEEVTPPAGYVTSGDAYYVLLKGSDYATISNAVKAFKTENNVEINEMVSGSALYIENTPGYSVTVNKRDQNGAVVTGAEFTLYKKETASGVYDEVETKEVDENGKASFTKNLLEGHYKLVETKVPDGYTGSFEEEFDISDTYMTFTFDVVNTKQYGSYTITKKGSDGVLLPGVEFTLYDESNNVVATKKTDTNGTVVFDNLELGKQYTVKETKGVDGYNVDETPWTFTLTSTQLTGSKDVTNQKQNGQIAITKVNAKDAAEKIADVVFELYDENKQVIKDSNSKPLRSTTDANGIATFTGLSYGTYYVREISAPSDCILDDTLHKITVDSDVPATITIQNEKRTLVTPYFSFYIEKQDGTGQALAGATFKLYRANGKAETLSDANLIQTAVSGSDGKVYFVNLNNDMTGNPDQYYTLLETEAPYGYEIASSKYVFKLSQIDVANTYGHATEYTVNDYSSIKRLDSYGTNGVITNDKITGQIKLVKNDGSGNALSGAVYGAYVDGVQKAVGTSNNAGEIIFSGLTYGTTYVIKENTPPDGYSCSNKEFTVKIGDKSAGSGYVDTVSGLYQYEITATDQKLQLSVSKKSITGASEIVGAKLALYDSADNQIDAWTSIGSMHTVDSAKLKVHGVYTLKELSAPTGYGYSKDVKFQILSDGSIQLLHGSDENAAVSGSVVTMRDREISFKLAKVDTDGNRIGGAGLQVQIKAGSQTLYSWDSSTGYDLDINSANAERIGIRVPDTLGSYNEYIYHEVSAPKGYEKSVDIPFYIDYYGNVYLKDTGGNYVPVPDNRIVMTDADSTTDIKVNKVEAVGGAPVRNAKLEIVEAATNTRVTSWDTTYSTKVLDGTLFEKGKKYLLREVSAPEGYAYAPSVEFTIDTNGQVEIGGKVVSGNLINMIDKRIDLKYDKVSHDTGNKLSHAKIGVYEEGTNQLIYQFETDGTTVDIGKYLNAGYYDSLGNTQEKEYYFRELVAPFGYTVASDIYFKLATDGTVSVKNSDGTYQKLQSNVIAMEDASVYMKVNKTDAQGTGLAGAKLQIEDSAGQVITSWVTNGTVSNIELWQLTPYTAANPNVYTLREVQAPYGYEKADPIEFYITDSYDLYVKNGDTFVKDASGILSMIDLQKKILISKVDAANSEKLDGAKLKITDASGTELVSWVTSKQEGAKQLDVLQFQPDTEYVLTEVSAPTGYKLADAITFKVGSDNVLYVKKSDGSFTTVDSWEIVMKDEKEDITTSEETTTQETTTTEETTTQTSVTTELTTSETQIVTTETTTTTTTTTTSSNTSKKTGDAAPITPVTALMLVSAVGIIVLGVRKKKQNDK